MTSFSYPMAILSALPFSGATIGIYYSELDIKSQITRAKGQTAEENLSRAQWTTLEQAHQAGRTYAVCAVISSIWTITISVVLFAEGVFNLPLTASLAIFYSRAIYQNWKQMERRSKLIDITQKMIALKQSIPQLHTV